MQFKIIEIDGKDKTGLVGHSVVTPLKRLAEFVSYNEARAIVEKAIGPNDTVVEIYTSSGNQATYTAAEFLAEQEQIRQKYGY